MVLHSGIEFSHFPEANESSITRFDRPFSIDRRISILNVRERKRRRLCLSTRDVPTSTRVTQGHDKQSAVKAPANRASAGRYLSGFRLNGHIESSDIIQAP